MYPYRKKLIGTAQSLRKRMTPEERHLWYDFLKKLPVTVYRQKTIENMIVDFYIASAKIVIEVDGIQHSSPENEMVDRRRDHILASYGITVLRYSNENIHKNFSMVKNDILEKLGYAEKDLLQ